MTTFISVYRRFRQCRLSPAAARLAAWYFQRFESMPAYDAGHEALNFEWCRRTIAAMTPHQLRELTPAMRAWTFQRVRDRLWSLQRAANDPVHGIDADLEAFNAPSECSSLAWSAFDRQCDAILQEWGWSATVFMAELEKRVSYKWVYFNFMVLAPLVEQEESRCPYGRCLCGLPFFPFGDDVACTSKSCQRGKAQRQAIRDNWSE